MGEAPATLPRTVGVGRLVVEEDVEETRAARLDGWIAWEAEEGTLYLSFLPSVFLFNAHRARWGRRISLVRHRYGLFSFSL